MNTPITPSRRPVWYALSFLVPLGICAAVLLLLGIHPFGDNTLLIRDSTDQYIAFAAYLKTVFAGENDLLYTFSKNLGGEMVSLFAYYLLSPFSFLFGLFSYGKLPMAFTLVIVLKVALCGLTFFYATGKVHPLKPIHLAFSTAYALMAYNTIYGWNIMWLDGVLILPLMVLGLKRLWKDGSAVLYCVALAYALLTNFYIGYMLCIASVLISLCLVALEPKLLKKNALRYVFASCVSGFSTAFVWLSSFLAIMGGRGQYSGNIFTDGRFYNFNPLGLAGKVLVGTCSPSQVSTGTPHIYCGIAALLLVLMFVFLRNIPRKNKLLGISLLAFFLVSFLFRIPNIIWHGFSQNYAFNFRYAFIFSYVMLMIAQDMLPYCEKADKKPLLLSGSLVLLLILAVTGMKFVMKLDFISLAGCFISFVMLAVLLVFFQLKKAKRNHLWPALLVLLILESAANYGISLNSVIGIDKTLNAADYADYIRRVTPAVDYVKDADPGFYRLEKTFQQDHNDAMTFAYNGLSHFSSSQQGRVPMFMEKMGFKNCLDVWSYYHNGSTSEAESLLGVSYVLSEEDLSVTKGYSYVNKVGDISIYRNPNALPLAMLAGPSVSSVDMDESDYFALHNDIWTAVGRNDLEVLHPASYNVKLNNLTETTLADGSMAYSRTDPQKEASLVFTLEVTQEHPLYCYFTAPDTQDVQLKINGSDAGEYFSTYRWDMVNAGIYRTGEQVTVELCPVYEDFVLTQPYFYYEDQTALEAQSEAIREFPVTLERLSSSHLAGTYDAQIPRKLLFTIPYDSGWKLLVDGEAVALEPALELFFCAAVPQGQHSFELRYTPPGMTAGFVLCFISVIAAAAYLLIEKRKK